MSESRQIRFIIAGCFTFLFTGYLSCVEFKYMIWGETVDAKIIKVTKGIDLDSDAYEDRKILGVRYQFDEVDGTSREGVVNMEIDWQAPGTGVLEIDYLPGIERASRLSGERKLFPVVVFFLATGLLTFLFVRLYRKAYE